MPDLPHCVRCGAVLGAEGGSRRYAAAPHERQLVPHVVSSIFPHLPRSSMRAFAAALGFGSAVVVALGLAQLYSIALVVAALVVPALLFVYVAHVSVYEREPFLVYGLTALWGAAAGVGLGLVGLALAPSTAELVAQSTEEALLEQGVLVPLLGLVLALAGPAVLLVHPRFNDVLDGTTFGAVSAAWVTAAQLLTHAASLVDDGLRPGGPPLDWTLRLFELAVFVPVLWAALVGAAAGSLWLRCRAPVGDRSALGILGNPFFAIPLAAAGVALAACVHVLAPVEVAFAVAFILAALALVSLRRAIHVGLLQEALEIEIGPPQGCANCGATTPRHTFCGACGIAFRALPKRRLVRTS